MDKFDYMDTKVRFGTLAFYPRMKLSNQNLSQYFDRVSKPFVVITAH